MSSTDLAYQRDMFILNAFGGGCHSDISLDLSEYDKAIQEYEAMLDYAIERNDKQEIKQLRSEIQHTKAEKRIAKRMIDTNQREKELAYT